MSENYLLLFVKLACTVWFNVALLV